MIRLTYDFPESPDPSSPSVRRVFRDPVRVVAARGEEEVVPALEAVEAATSSGLYAAGYLSYEAAAGLEDRMRVRAREGAGGPPPLLWFGLFDGLESGPSPAARGGGRPVAAEWSLELDRGQYAGAVAAVRAAIREGHTYQVNLTARLRATLDAATRADAAGLYESLRGAQGSGWHALLELEDRVIASVSPELFFHARGRSITARPMKGTRPRGRWRAEDEALARELASSEKDRAENLMIVDLLRNDLGRVCAPGTVRVPRLFEVERYRTVWQLTSTVEGRLRAGVGLVELFRALFPCGSVTGAPKLATMEVIAALEPSPRDVYCGAIGVVEPGGDAVFNVPIRTLWWDPGTGAAEYGTGGGVVWDSTAEAEHDELAAKAVVVREPWPEIGLVETLALEGGRLLRLDRHLDRLRESAAHFGLPFDEEEVRRALASAVARASGDGGSQGAGAQEAMRVRVVLESDGRVAVGLEPLGLVGREGPEGPEGPDGADGAEAAGALPVALATRPVDSRDRFLFHKTTHRRVYEDRRAEHPGAFDVLLRNERGELTEFTRGNLVVRLDGRLFTPPLTSGLLAGCLRQELLEAGTIEAAVLRAEDLGRAEGVWFINSARRWLAVRLEPGPAVVG